MNFESFFRTGAEKPAYFYSQWLFLKILALAYLAAFGSLWPQVDGLIGARGILPSGLFLSYVKHQWGAASYWYVPTFCWLDSSNSFLHLLCGGGVVLSLLLLAGVAPAACLALLWLFYLSLVSVGQDFLSFQWDNLLLEAGFLAVFLAPLQWRWKRNGVGPPPAAFLFLFRWFLFRLMFSSGMVKLLSGDEAWKSLTALQYHYETQPLPTPLAWWANQLPPWFQKLSCLSMFGVELAAPLFIFGPRKLRPAAFLLMASLQVLILLTGNYCFFNLLTLGLCLFALEDKAWPSWFKLWWGPIRQGGDSKTPPWLAVSFAALMVLLSLPPFTATLGFRSGWPLISGLDQLLAPLRSVNSYGLFSIMTTTRPEIEVSGSDDGVHWEPYRFKFKPGDLGRPPGYVAPYQPRLDWQMWFAALGDFRDNPWFGPFLAGLLEGSPDVLGLLGDNPFPGKPPKWIKAEVYEYHFTNRAEKARTGNWWKAEYKGPYIGPFSLDQVRSSGGSN